MKSKKENTKSNIYLIIEDIVFYSIIVPIIIIAVMVLWQKFFQPDKIPHIFGYKLFLVLDGNMDENISYGDLAITHNVNPKKLKINDIIAFRNIKRTVTIHRIEEIENKEDKKMFTMKTALNETEDTKYVEDKEVEGILVHKIAKIGLILYYMQHPLVLLVLICFVLIIGLIIYYVAQELDKRDLEKLKNN